jgi:hypothetical protein
MLAKRADQRRERFPQKPPPPWVKPEVTVENLLQQLQRSKAEDYWQLESEQTTDGIARDRRNDYLDFLDSVGVLLLLAGAITLIVVVAGVLIGG